MKKNQHSFVNRLHDQFTYSHHREGIWSSFSGAFSSQKANRERRAQSVHSVKTTKPETCYTKCNMSSIQDHETHKTVCKHVANEDGNSMYTNKRNE